VVKKQGKLQKSLKKRIKMAFRTPKRIENMVKTHSQTDQHEKSGIYKKCMDCPLKYIGQTGRKFYTGYEEHIRTIRNDNSNPGYSNHTLNTGHTYGSITDTMNIIRTEKKRKTPKHIRKIPHI
jgi:hypothetical protein